MIATLYLIGAALWVIVFLGGLLAKHESCNAKGTYEPDNEE